MNNSAFKSNARDFDGLTGVFERDEYTSYFYLYDRKMPEGKKILGAINVSERLQKSSDADINILWNGDKTQVQLFCRDELIATFRPPEKS